MLGARIEAYRIEAELGSGGMGTVYRARVEDEDPAGPPGTLVAIKVVHPHLVEKPGILERYRREAELGSQVVHPSVVRTYSAGTAVVDGDRRHYLIMEYVEGRTLRDLLAELGTVPEGLLREIARQCAGGLAAIHAAGIVHRDLKPENVLITDDERIRIMDLGVAKLAEESVILTLSDEFVGSFPYAAPEQFRGEDVGTRSDLYSLGVALYELAVGRNPFRFEDPARIFAAHIEMVPEGAAEVNPRVSPFLSRVLSSLLEKRPEDRFASAADLAEALGAGERSAWWISCEKESVRTSVLPVVPVTRETLLHGREGEMGALRDAWERARAGNGGTVLLEGEAGIGKTRLVDAFLSELRVADAHLLYGSYPPSGGLGALSEAIIDHLGAANLEKALRPYLPVTPRLVPAFAAMLKHEAPPEGSEPVEGDALHTLFCHLLHGLATDRPLLWVVDDLQFAGPDSRRIFLSLARAAAGYRVLLVGTTRPGLPEEDLMHLGRVEGFHRVAIGRLSPREVIELLRDAFHSESLADRLGAQIAFKSDGVPFFVFEMIRGLREGRFIELGADGTFVATRVIDRIEVPSAVRDLVTARLADLSEEERATLDVGAVQGFEFRADLIAKVRDLRPLVVLERLATVERRSGIVRSDAEGYRFDHHQIQEVLYEDIPVGLRSEYHAALAEAFGEFEEHVAEGSPGPRGEAAVFLASHHLRGSRPRHCLPALDAAITHLEQTYRNEMALDLIDRSLGIPGLIEDELRGELLLRKAGRLQILGRVEGEREALDGALEIAARSGSALLLAKGRSGLGAHLLRIGRYADAEEALTKATELARSVGDRDVEAQALQQLGNVLWSRESYGSARDKFEAALTIARETGDRGREALAVGSLGNVSLALTRYEEAREAYEESLRIAADAGDRRLEAWIAGNLGSVYWNLGRKEDARASYERSLAIAREIGDRNLEATATGNLGRVHDHVGGYEEARQLLQRRIEMARESGAARGEAIAQVNLGFLLGRVGELESAERVLRAARASFEEMGAPSMLAFALLGLGAVCRCRGDLEDAVRLHREARALRLENEDLVGAASALAPLGEIYIRQGDIDRARIALEEAVRECREARPETAVLAAARLATLPGGDAGTALELFAASKERLDAATEMEARYLLYRATGDEEHLRESHRLLLDAQEHIAEEGRGAMIRNVPLHREIVDAWAAIEGGSEIR